MRVDYEQKGETINYTNINDETIFAGTVVALGKRVGVAGCDIAPKTLGSLHTIGVFRIPKSSATTSFSVGDIAYYDKSGAVDTGDIKIGWVVEPSISGSSDVLVKID